MSSQGVETCRGVVYPWQCDHMGHLNVTQYVALYDVATWQLFGLMGLTPSLLRESGRGMAAVRQVIEYQRELLVGDLIVISSQILEVGERKVRFAHEMRDATTGELSSTCEMTAVHLDREARKAVPFPEAVRATAEALAGPGGDDEVSDPSAPG